ncbi:hypothetical protein IMCC3135_20635 [Granulosicoccus antarcticus IMCC3135]|uniref:Uncharacterized protein n=1 Tax=Granulosicoccus antarcticus IMCC3135 TaxID=1192854 RepID=A0A2Z2P369_9GAMM|nr:hypothetical protein IMCC3135_20635 [Granulosicoccus antarcticus IMCC3135]
MKTLENAKRTMRRTMGRVIAVATFSAMAIAAAPAQATTANATDAFYRTAAVPTSNQNAARIIPAELTIGIELAHGYGHNRGNDRHRNEGHNSRRNDRGRSDSRRGDSRHHDRQRRHYGASEGHYGRGHNKHGSSRRDRSHGHGGHRRFLQRFHQRHH